MVQRYGLLDPPPTPAYSTAAPAPSPTPTPEKRTYGDFGFGAALKSIVPGASNVKGAYTDWNPITEPLSKIELDSTSSVSRTHVVDVAVNDVIKVTNLTLKTSANTRRTARLPIAVPDDAKVSVRCANNGATSISASIRGGKAANGIAGAGGIGAITPATNTATTNGVMFDPVADLNVLKRLTGGALTTANALNTALTGLLLQAHEGSVSSRTNSIYVFEIWIGADAAQTLLIPNIQIASSTSAIADGLLDFLDLDVANGAELWGKVVSNSGAAANTFLVALHGVF